MFVVSKGKLYRFDFVGFKEREREEQRLRELEERNRQEEEMRRREEAEKYKDAEKILEVGLCIHVSKMRIGKLYFGNIT